MTAWPSINRLEELTGWSRNTVIKNLEALESESIIAIQRERREDGTNKNNVYTVQTDLISVWIGGKKLNPRGSSKIEPGVVQNLTGGSSKNEPEVLTNRSINKSFVGKPDDAPSEAIPFDLIVDHLNEKTGRKFRSNSKQTRQHIRARWREGYTLEDFKAVIDVKTAEWFDDPKMSKFLRPKTLFLPENFESYLNQSVGQPEVNKITELQDRKLTDAEALQYLDYFQFVRDHYPRLFKNVRMLTASQYFDIRTGGKRYNALRRWFPANKMKRLFAQAHDEINTGLGIGRRYVDVKTELDSILKAPDYA